MRLGEGLVDDTDGRRIRIVALLEDTSFAHADAQANELCHPPSSGRVPLAVCTPGRARTFSSTRVHPCFVGPGDVRGQGGDERPNPSEGEHNAN